MRQYFKTPKKLLISSFLPILIGLIFVVVIIYAWTEPSQPPPGCSAGQPGCDAPLNVGPNYQTKIGPLVLNTGGATTGLIVQKGNVVIGDSSSSMALSQPNIYGDSTRLELNYDNADTEGFLQITKNGNRAMQLDDGALFVDNNRAIRARINDNQGVGLNPIRQDYATHPEQITVQPPKTGDITWFGDFGFLGWDGTKWVSLQGGGNDVGVNLYSCHVTGPGSCNVACLEPAKEMPLGCTMDPYPSGAAYYWKWYWSGPYPWLWRQARCYCYGGLGADFDCEIICLRFQQ